METLKGVGVSPGIGIGHVMLIVEPDLTYTPGIVEDIAAEKERLQAAVDAFTKRTMAKAAAVRERVGEAEAGILEGHALMIGDPYMTDEMGKLIDAGTCAEMALTQVCDMFAQMFEDADNELIAQRVTDIRDVQRGVLSRLLGVEEVDISAAPAGSVIVTHDLTPSMTSEIVKENVVGIVTEVGGTTSHSAILARAMEIPAVLSVEGACSALASGEAIIVDGSEGDVLADPDAASISTYAMKHAAYKREREALKQFIGKATVTADGTQVELFANIGKPDDAKAVMDNDGEGVGLFRTEFLFMNSTSMPSEDEQFEAYRNAALILKGRPLVIRTLDIGGDKDIPYMNFEHEDNPFMGFRAVRYCLANPDMYRAQLRALIRASAFGDIRIMVPLVTCVDEVRAVRALVEKYTAELDSEGVDHAEKIQVGVMVETPAASLIADLLAQEADFFSIGTNDLTGYTMCADRGNNRVRYLYSTFSPAVVRSVKHIIETAHEFGTPVGMCGESAADPLLVPLWVSFGLDEYSVSATSILATRRAIAQWSREDADALAKRVLELKTEEEIHDLLRSEAR